MSSFSGLSSISTYLPSLTAQYHLGRAQQGMNALVNQLSSGSRLDATDGANLAISSGLSAQIGSLGQAQRNAQDAISYVQTAQGGLSQVDTLLARMQTLAVQGANGVTLNQNQRDAINTEYQGLAAEVDRIAQSTTYNGTALLDGSAGNTSFQVGAGNTAADRLDVAMPKATTASLGLSGTSVNSAANSQNAMSAVSQAIAQLGTSRAALGTYESSLGAAADTAATQRLSLLAANSRIADTDYASSASAYTMQQVRQQAALAVLGQANSQPAMLLALLNPRPF